MNKIKTENLQGLKYKNRNNFNDMILGIKEILRIKI